MCLEPQISPGTTLLSESRPRHQRLGAPPLQVLCAVVAMAVGLALCGALVYRSGLRLGDWLAVLRGVDLRWAGIALGGMAVNLVLAAQKWRRVEACLAGNAPGLHYAVGITAIGWGLGQFLPVPVAAAMVRGLGNRAASRSARHGALASAWEQLFDLAAALLLAAPAVAALMHCSASAVTAGLAIAILIGEAGAVGIPRLLGRLTRMEAKLSSPSLCRFLWRVSLIRTAVLMVVTVVIAQAMRAEIPHYSIAEAVPPVIVAGVLSFVPAGIGVNEVSFVGLLGVAGVAAPVATGFALVNRLVQLAIALLLALGGTAMVGLAASSRNNP